jgi:Putative binding domain, N-terminal
MKGIPRRYLLAGLALCLLIVGQDVRSAWADSDPGVPGPLAVTREEYDFGDTAFSPPSGLPGPVEVRASVHYPTGLPGGPFPLVVFLHGRHLTCFESSSAFLQWPCSAGRSPIPSFQGYDYVSQILASDGYIVVSISANGINARDSLVVDAGMQARAELIQHHLDVWNAFNTTGGAPFGTKFVGKVDMNNIGTMGHSRGGEGVVRHFLHNISLGSPYGIRAVFPLAPVDFNRPVINAVPLSVLLPYCDGDVSDLQGVHFFDDARYSAPGDLSPKHTLLIKGANHNFYNTAWSPSSGIPGAADDWLSFVSGGSSDPHCGTVPGNGRLTEAQQRGTAIAYLNGFFRRYLGGESAFDPMFKGDVPPPPSAMTSDIHVSYHAPDHPAQRRDVNRLLDSTHLTVNTLGGAATQTGLTPYDLCGGESPQPELCLPTQSTARQPHTTPSQLYAERGLSQLRGGWSSTKARYTNDLPLGARDVSGFQVIQFRVSVDFSDARNLAGVAQDFSVRLTDGTGALADARISDFSEALFFPPGAAGPLPKVVLNTVRIPISTFAAGLNLSDVRSVQFIFDQTTSGALLITDVAFADSATQAPTNCTYLLSPTGRTFRGSGGTDGMAVTAPNGCAWTAVSDAPWITIMSGQAGAGTGTVTYAVAANVSRRNRTGTMTIAGQTFTVKQRGR